MTSAMDLAAGYPALENAVRRSRALLHRRALMAGAAGAVPLPGLDWAVDAALLSRLIPAISGEFGLLPNQIDQMDPERRERVKKGVAMVGSVLIGKFVTQDLIVRLAKTAGLKLTAKQAARYVPLAGQVVSAMMGYATLRFLGEQHIRDCVQVALWAQRQLPQKTSETIIMPSDAQTSNSP